MFDFVETAAFAIVEVFADPLVNFELDGLYVVPAGIAGHQSHDFDRNALGRLDQSRSIAAWTVFVDTPFQ